VSGFEIGQIVVVGIDDSSMNVADKIGSPGFKCVDNSKKFFVVDVPVLLCRI
jgi:hypothetical protein